MGDNLTTTAAVDASGSVPVGHGVAVLRIVAPEALRGRIALGAEPVVLGREDDHGRITHSTVSRRHLEVQWDPQIRSHVVRDLGSRNGSRVDGAPIGDERCPVTDGTVIVVGHVPMVYELHPVRADDTDVSTDAVFGDSPAARSLRAAVSLAAADPSPVLVTGETGTGKEFVSREIHRLSRRTGPFQAANCAALSAQLFESQLFGHERGAFTGAVSSSKGFFRLAERGTLLLDEIGDLEPSLQPKLLRVLQESEVVPIGAEAGRSVDVRVIAATNQPLAEMV